MPSNKEALQKNMKKIFFILLSLSTINSIYCQETSEIDEEQNLLSKCFFDLSPIEIPDYPIFRLNLCSVLNCLVMYQCVDKIKEPIDLTDYKKQIIERINEISVRLYLEGNPVYLTNGMDCNYYAKEENSKKENNDGVTYVCYADCVISKSDKEFADIFNYRTTQLIKNKNNKIAKQ